MKIRSKGGKLDFTATAAATVSRAIGEDLFDGSALLWGFSDKRRSR
jgi:hypothetical protein